MSPTDRATAVIKNVRENEMFNPPSDRVWQREIENAIIVELSDKVPVADFLRLYDSAHAVIDHIRLHVDHAEYEGSMNAVQDFREIAAQLRWKHDDKVPDPLNDTAFSEEDEL